MVPSRLQLMLRPPKSEGHIPPVICASVLQQLPENAVCCGTKAAQVSQAEAKSLNLLGSGRHAADGEGVAVMQYTALPTQALLGGTILIVMQFGRDSSEYS